MASGPFLLPEDEQDELNRQEMASFGGNAPGGGVLAWGGIPGAPLAGMDPPKPRPRPGRNPFGGGRRASLYSGPFRAGDGGMIDSFNMAQAMVGQQGAHLAGMANQAMSAINGEHSSRVSQMREAARLEHEKELMRMQMAAQKRASDADLIRSLLAGG
jgi:hypothetical protein